MATCLRTWQTAFQFFHSSRFMCAFSIPSFMARRCPPAGAATIVGAAKAW